MSEPTDDGRTRENEPTMDDYDTAELDVEEDANDGPAHGYGLPTPRDEQTGELLPDTHAFPYQWNGEDIEVQIRLIPPTLEQIEVYQNFGKDATSDDLREVVDRHIIEPDIPAQKMTMREVNCFVFGIIDYGNSGGGDRMQEVREYIKEREGRAGN